MRFGVITNTNLCYESARRKTTDEKSFLRTRFLQWNFKGCMHIPLIISANCNIES